MKFKATGDFAKKVDGQIFERVSDEPTFADKGQYKKVDECGKDVTKTFFVSHRDFVSPDGYISDKRWTFSGRSSPEKFGRAWNTDESSDKCLENISNFQKDFKCSFYPMIYMNTQYPDNTDCAGIGTISIEPGCATIQ